MGEVGGQGDEVEEVSDGLEGVVDLVGDGAGETTDGGELFALDESGFSFFLVGDLEDDGGDGLDRVVGIEDWRVTDVEGSRFAGSAREFALKELAADGMTCG